MQGEKKNIIKRLIKEIHNCVFFFLNMMRVMLTFIQNISSFSATLNSG